MEWEIIKTMRGEGMGSGGVGPSRSGDLARLSGEPRPCEYS